MKNLQKRAVRSHFVKPIVRMKQNVQVSMDLYGYGKTVQFIMANTEIKPALTRKETYQIGKMIDKCIGENAQRQYDDFSQVRRDIPIIKERSGQQVRKYAVMGIITLSLIGYGAFMTIQANVFRQQRDKLILQMKEKTIKGEEDKNDMLYNEAQEENFR